MKIERHTGMHVAARAATPPPIESWSTNPRRSFDTALREQRRRVSTGDASSPRRADSTTPKPRERGSPAGERSTSRVPGSVSDHTAPQTQRHAMPLPGEPDLQAAPWIERSRRPRWPHARTAHASPCFEVAHAPSGSRFLLSREGGVWLLSIQSGAHSQAEIDSIVAELREQFQRQGLGHVDVILTRVVHRLTQESV
jgi:hypothetical protein